MTSVVQSLLKILVLIEELYYRVVILSDIDFDPSGLIFNQDTTYNPYTQSGAITINFPTEGRDGVTQKLKFTSDGSAINLGTDVVVVAGDIASVVSSPGEYRILLMYHDDGVNQEVWISIPETI